MNKLVDNQYTSPSQGNAWLDAARHHGLLSRLPDSVVATVVKGAQRVEYPQGTIGLRWDEAPKAAIVLRGTIRSFITYPDGAQVTIRFSDARKGTIVLDVTDDEADEMGRKGRRQARRGRRPKAVQPT